VSSVKRPLSKPDALRSVVSISSRLPRKASALQRLPREQTGSVTFISTWLESHAEGNSCQACEGLGFCLRCDARGCEECRSGLCERCHGMGLRLDASGNVNDLLGGV
jgi:hypothetical protein